MPSPDEPLREQQDEHEHGHESADGQRSEGDGEGQEEQHRQSGQRVVWFMNGTTRTSIRDLGTGDPDWKVAGGADFNADGVPDLVIGAEDGRLYYLRNPRGR